MIDWYILDQNHEAIMTTALKWNEWIVQDPTRRIVKQTKLPNGHLVSTVFLGLDHSHQNSGAPVLFETVIFADDNYEDETNLREYILHQERYAT